jgi:hypothetical protein
MGPPQLIGLVLEPFMLRVTNIKDLCCDLASTGQIKDTWKVHGRKKPRHVDWIELAEPLKSTRQH